MASGQSFTNIHVPIFNSILSSGVFPDSIIVTVYKSGSRNDLATYRGIYVQNVLKYFKLCYLSGLKCEIKYTKPRQVSERVILVQIICLPNKVQKYISQKGGRFYVLNVDFRTAFDSIRHLDMFNCLNRKGISGTMLRLLIALYSHMRSYVRVNDILSESMGRRQYNNLQFVYQ